MNVKVKNKLDPQCLRYNNILMFVFPFKKVNNKFVNIFYIFVLFFNNVNDHCVRQERSYEMHKG